MTPEKQDKTLELSKHWSVFKSVSAAEWDWLHFACHHLGTVSLLSQQSKQSGFGDDLV